MNMNQLYNKSIVFHPSEIEENEFDLNFNVYNGKLTTIADYFNKFPVEDCMKIVANEKDSKNSKRSPLEIASFLDFSNIFLYLLTYNADPYYIDENGQSIWHIIFYRGYFKLLSILLNYERYKIQMDSLIEIDNIKKSFGFSKLDIVKGKLSRAVNHSNANINKFNLLQKALKDEGIKRITVFIKKLENALLKKDKDGQTPFHLAAMSKFPLSHLVINMAMNFDFFKYDETWDEFLKLYEELQYLEVKEERINDPRRSLRMGRELLTLLGDDIIKSFFSPQYQILKRELMKKIINTQDNQGDSVLHISAFHGDYRIVSKLVSFGGDKQLRNDDFKLPVDLAKDNFVRKVLTNLNKAARSSDEKNIVELVHFGHDINSKLSIFSQAPIHKIIESKDENKYVVLKKILDMGGDPNIKDSNGWTALHYACQFGDLESVKILIAAKAIIDTYSNNHRIPLHLASMMNYPAIVKFLLDNKSDSNYKDHLGCTPLHLAAKQGNIKCIEHLLAYNSNLYEEDFRKWNILHYAAFHGHHLTVRFISKYDADYDFLQTSRNSQNKLPIEIVRDPSVKHYFISLWHAAKEGNLDMIRLLIHDGEDVNELSHFEKNTPLHYAVLNNHYLLARLLIENKAERDIRNKDNIIPYEYASIMNHGISKLFSTADDPLKEMIDLRSIVRSVINKNEKVLNSVVCQSNWNIRLWNVNDFNTKICKLFS